MSGVADEGPLDVLGERSRGGGLGRHRRVRDGIVTLWMERGKQHSGGTRAACARVHKQRIEAARRDLGNTGARVHPAPTRPGTAPGS